MQAIRAYAIGHRLPASTVEKLTGRKAADVYRMIDNQKTFRQVVHHLNVIESQLKKLGIEFTKKNGLLASFRYKGKRYIIDLEYAEPMAINIKTRGKTPLSQLLKKSSESQ